MVSYMVLTPPGPRPDPMAIRFVRDGFSLAALVVPLFWMLYHRMWLFAGLLVVAEIAVALVIQTTGATGAGMVVTLAINLLIALESGQIRAMHLISKGWSGSDVVAADRLGTAEQIYFSNQPDQAKPSPSAASASASPVHGATEPALGLFDYGRGR